MNLEKKVVKREVKTTVNEEVFVLELSREEAAALVAAVGGIGGHTDENNIRTVVTDKIYNELSKAGINFFTPEVSKYARNISKNMRVGRD